MAETVLWTRDDSEVETLRGAYFAHVASDDLRTVSRADQRARVEEHLQLAGRRTDAAPEAAVVVGERRSIAMVVTDDMPHLVDSVTAEVSRHGLAMSLVVHPIVLTTRETTSGELLAVREVPTAQPGMSSGDTQTLPDLAALVDDESRRTAVESWIAVDIDHPIDEEQAGELTEGLRRVIGDVAASHRDQDRMGGRARGAAGLLRENDSIEEAAESADLLDWMADGNFLFLGYCEYVLDRDSADGAQLVPQPDSALGILAERHGLEALHREPARERSPEASAEESAEEAARERALVITKANTRSSVRRRTYMDYVAVKTFGSDGSVAGERRFVGLFSQSAYTQSIVNIPLLRSRADQLLRRSGFSPDSHSGADLLQILEVYPRNELLQMDITEVEDTAWQILQLQERRRIKLFLRKDLHGRFMTALLYMPRDRFNTAVRRRVQDELMRHVDAESIDFNVRLTESVLARLFFRMRLSDDAAEMALSIEELQAKLARTIRSWGEGIAQEAAASRPEGEAERIAGRWGEAFPDDYRVVYEVPEALADIAELEKLEAHPEAGPRMQFYAPGGEDPADMRLKLYLTEPKTLTETLPVLDDFGLSILDERSYTLTCGDGSIFHLYDLGIGYPEGIEAGSVDIGQLEEAYSQVLLGTAESDVFSRLVLRLGLDIRTVIVLRAYAKYMRQLGSSHSYDFLAETLRQNPEVALALVRHFEARFDPAVGTGGETGGEDGGAEDREQLMDRRRQEVLDALEQVRTLDADRVLSAFLNLIDATERTNVHQGHVRVALKIAPDRVDSAPEPRPAHEVFVYAPDVEGVHLRFAKVARGGLRWSDRQEDFRTEVLGLVKAQMVKNAVIVPSGAKGGFYPKQLPDQSVGRAEWMEAGKAAYRTFIRGLLDVTDNQVERDGVMEIVPPRAVVRHDGDDPYLVVAADKGTATFSDTANAISQEYGHWLGDAFASGGSVGYDHKEMGITARGAWESVKAHFSEMGHDTQSEDFTVVGIGDMAGDVFGNGMLLSEHIRLVAAFNHLHIFIDPDPDAAASFAERSRLFAERPSGWDAYDEGLISAGGGVFSRTAKTIPISEPMRRRFDLPADVEQMTPPELIGALLKAPVDLLYNGGIGTYVKAAEESHDDVGDRANNAVRVDGRELRARVVGEGGNLGLTQAGRIEAAQQGVRLNTDAIDNSAGVDCSDHEVNIKILVDQLVASGHLDADERPELLHSMTEEVAELVLETNRDQNVVLLTDRHRLGDWSPSFHRLMGWLEETVGLDRELEGLPTDEQLAARRDAEEPLTSPELAVLVAWSKIQLKGALVESSLPDDEWFTATLEEYFPSALTDRFASQLPRHPLQREIIANEVANDVVDMGGATFVFRAMEETFATEEQVVRAFVAVRELFRLGEFDAAMRELPVSFPRDEWAHTYLDMRRLLDRAVRWFVNHAARGTSVQEDVEAFAEHIRPLYGRLEEHLREEDRRRVAAKREAARSAGMPEQLADWVGEVFESFSLLDIAALAAELDVDSADVADVYFAVYAEFDIDALLVRITDQPRRDKWQALARGAQRDELYRAVREVTESVLTTTEPGDAETRLLSWREAHEAKISRVEKLVDEVNQVSRDNVASLTVLLRHLRGMIGA